MDMDLSRDENWHFTKKHRVTNNKVQCNISKWTLIEKLKKLYWGIQNWFNEYVSLYSSTFHQICKVLHGHAHCFITPLLFHMVYKAGTPPSPLVPVGLVGNPKNGEPEGGY